MWQLKTISAQNICAFRELEYSPLQGHTTLIFGNNLDNDSQGSNGSGKSALIEAFAIALTGESLRKVNTEEIINDAFDEARLTCVLVNDVTNDKFEIERTFSRNDPQTISILYNGEKVVLSSILEYNRHILNVIGLSKDDIFSSFILSKHKYSSFLNASDRIKKELINRFSNGNLVDESIGHLKEDIEQAKDVVFDAEKRVANSEGRVSTIVDQIDSAHAEASEQVRKRDELITAHKEAISRLRGQIREANQSITEREKRLGVLDEIVRVFEDLESSPTGIEECFREIMALFQRHSFSGRTMKDYPKYSNELNDKLAEYEQRVKSSLSSIAGYEKEVSRACKIYEELLEQHEKLQAENTPICKGLQAEIDEANKIIADLTAENRKVIDDSAKLQKEISRLKGLLAGTIECPACHHRFLLESEYSIEQLQQQLDKVNKRLNKNHKTEDNNGDKIDEAHEVVNRNRKELTKIDKNLDELATSIRDANIKTNNLRKTLDTLQLALSGERNQVSRLQGQIASLRKNLFDDVFDIVDSEIRQTEADIDKFKVMVSTAQGNISSYEEAIKNLEDVSTSDAIEKLEQKKSEYETELQVHVANLESANAQLSELIQQEARFVAFKTHLANSKIEALGQLTNEFLETIGSDIRIAFSGYTILKSGKVRDKISISLLRDGIDCGSFAKFSAGEQCRVNLASILALHKLTNVNCNDDKGLDLLILDEILDATDEAGLANMFDALNALQITSMVVSHGQIAEAYPYRLTVTKQNGISTLNGIEA
jgi:hypothetical protein